MSIGNMSPSFEEDPVGRKPYPIPDGTESKKLLDDNLERIMGFWQELGEIYDLPEGFNEDDVVKAIYNNGEPYTIIMSKLAIYYGLPASWSYERILRAKEIKELQEKKK